MSARILIRVYLHTELVSGNAVGTFAPVLPIVLIVRSRLRLDDPNPRRQSPAERLLSALRRKSLRALRRVRATHRLCEWRAEPKTSPRPHNGLDVPGVPNVCTLLGWRRCLLNATK